MVQHDYDDDDDDDDDAAILCDFVVWYFSCIQRVERSVDCSIYV